MSRQDGYHFADDIFNIIFLHENGCIFIQISLKSVPKGAIINIPALFGMISANSWQAIIGTNDGVGY